MKFQDPKTQKNKEDLTHKAHKEVKKGQDGHRHDDRKTQGRDDRENYVKGPRR